MIFSFAAFPVSMDFAVPFPKSHTVRTEYAISSFSTAVRSFLRNKVGHWGSGARRAVVITNSLQVMAALKSESQKAP